MIEQKFIFVQSRLVSSGLERGLTPDASPDGCGAGRENGGKTPAHRMDGVILSIILSVSGFFVIISLN